MIKIINGVNIYNVDEKCLIEMVENNHEIFKSIPLELLTENICKAAIINEYSYYNLIPMPLKTKKIKTTLIIYWGKLPNIYKLFNQDELNEIIFEILIKYEDNFDIPKSQITTTILEKLIANYDSSEFLTLCCSAKLLKKDNNIKKLYKKYGKLFLKNININIEESLYLAILKDIPECHYNDFKATYIASNIKRLMLQNNIEDICLANCHKIPSDIIDEILNKNIITCYHYLTKLSNKCINASQAEIMKSISFFKITDIPSAYVSAEEYINLITSSDDFTRISSDKFNAQLIHKIISFNIANVELLPKEQLSQEDIFEYLMKTTEPKVSLIKVYKWNNEHAIAYYNSHDRKYSNFVPKYFLEGKPLIDKNSLPDIEEYYLAVVAILDFLSSLKTNRVEYYVSRYTGSQIFINYLNIIKENNKELYQFYNEALNPDLKKLKNISVLTKYLITELSKPIENFTVLDYCQLTDLPINLIYPELLKEVNNLSLAAHEDSSNDHKSQKNRIIARYRQLCYASKKTNDVDIKLIIKDSRNITAKNYLSNEEIKQIFIYMYKNNIKMNNKSYMTVLSAYINGTININNIEDKIIDTGYISYQQDLAIKLNSYINAYQGESAYQNAYLKFHHIKTAQRTIKLN